MIGTLQEVIRDMKSGVYDFTKNGKCVGFGKHFLTELGFSGGRKYGSNNRF